MRTRSGQLRTADLLTFTGSCQIRARLLVIPATLTCPPGVCHVLAHERAGTRGDAALAIVAAVLTDQRGAGRRVAHPDHQFPESRSGSGGKMISGMPEIMKVHIS
jgi:hypothetical protein